MGEGALVAHLSAALAVEGRAVENKLEKLLVLDFYVAVTGDAHFGGKAIVTDKLLVDAGNELHPVIVLNGCSCTGAVFLLGKALVETFHVHSPALL